MSTNLEVLGMKKDILDEQEFHSSLMLYGDWGFDWKKNTHIRNNRFGPKEVLSH